MSKDSASAQSDGLNQIGRELFLRGIAVIAALGVGIGAFSPSLAQQAAPQSPPPSERSKPNILIIMADDIGWFNVSAYNFGVMGYRTPNIDQIAKEGAMFTDWYGDRAALPGAPLSSPDNRRSAQASRRSAFLARTLACMQKT
jgi:hypothetical protein